MLGNSECIECLPYMQPFIIIIREKGTLRFYVLDNAS